MRRFAIVLAVAMGAAFAATGDRGAEAADKLKAQKSQAGRTKMGMTYAQNTRGVKRGRGLKGKGNSKEGGPTRTFNLKDTFPQGFN